MIIVCPLSDLPMAIREEKPSAVATLLSPHQMIPEIRSVPEGTHLRLEMEDVSEERRGEMSPSETHVNELISFVRRWDQTGPLIVHCWAGISRSTAGALIAQVTLRPEADDMELADQLGIAAPHAKPNRLLIQYADKALGRGGRLIAAANSVWTDVSVYEGYRFYYPLHGST